MTTHAHEGQGHLLADPTTGTTTDSTANTMLPMYCRTASLPFHVPAIRVPLRACATDQLSGKRAEQQPEQQRHWTALGRWPTRPARWAALMDDPDGLGPHHPR
jgi:hypothetical protein